MSKVGVLGRGEVGRRLAGGFAGRGHDVTIGTRDPADGELQAWIAGEGAPIKASTPADAASQSDLLVLAVLGSAAEEAIRQAGTEAFTGKVVIDATNPLDFSHGFPPGLFVAGDDSLGERIQRLIPEAKVVKAFNTIGNPYFVAPSFSAGRPTMFIAGEDDEAKATVTEVLRSFGWEDVVDVGGIDGSRELESLAILWVKLGGHRGAWDHGFALLVG